MVPRCIGNRLDLPCPYDARLRMLGTIAREVDLQGHVPMYQAIDSPLQALFWHWSTLVDGRPDEYLTKQVSLENIDTILCVTVQCVG